MNLASMIREADRCGMATISADDLHELVSATDNLLDWCRLVTDNGLWEFIDADLSEGFDKAVLAVYEHLNS